MKTVPTLMHPRSLFKIAFIVAATCTLFIMCFEYESFIWEETISRATATDAVNEKIASVGKEIENVSLLMRERIYAVSLLLGLYASKHPADMALIQNRLNTFVTSHSDYGLMRYVTLDGIVSSPLSSEDEVQFLSVVDTVRAEGNKEIIISGGNSPENSAANPKEYVYVVSPVFVEGEIKGYLQMTISTKAIFQEIRRAARQGEEVFLMDQEGHTLVQSELSFQTEASVLDKYPPAIAERFFSSDPVGSFMYGDKAFSYRHIAVPNLHEGDDIVKYWVLVSASNQDILFHQARMLEQKFIATLLLWFGLILTGSIAVMLAKKSGRRTL